MEVNQNQRLGDEKSVWSPDVFCTTCYVYNILKLKLAMLLSSSTLNFHVTCLLREFR